MKINARVIVAKCNCGKLYGIRTEQRKDGWAFTWAFPISERMVNKENYSTSSDRMKGNFYFDAEYPGCPYCGQISITHCADCDKIFCSNDKDGVTECSWCHNRGTVRYTDEFDINGGAF